MMKIWKKIKYIFSNEDYFWYGKISRWLDPNWYKYVFKPWKGFRVSLCRLRGHPHGCVWYNVGGLEPDMSCSNCGEDLG